MYSEIEIGDVFAIYTADGLVNVRAEMIYDGELDGEMDVVIDDIFSDRDGESLTITEDDFAKVY